MVSADFLQADRCFAVFQLGYETPMLVLGFQHLATGLEIGIEARHFLPEVIQGAFKEVIGHKEVLLNIALFQTVTGLACQNHQFADNILSAEVDTRIGFGVTFLLCHLNGLAERNVGTDFIENIVQRTAQHGFNLQYLITAMNKVVNGIDDGESGTYICFKQVLHTALAGNLFQFTIVLVFRRSGNLVGSHYRNIVQQQVLVKGSHACTCRTVHKDRVKDVHTDNLITQRFQRAVLSLLLQFFTETSQIETFAAEHGFVCIGNAHYIQLQAVLLHQLLALAVDLLYQATAYGSYATDKEIQYLIFRQEERIMDDIQRFAQ